MFLCLTEEAMQSHNLLRKGGLSLLSGSEKRIGFRNMLSKKLSNDRELIQSDPTFCPQNQKGNN